MKKKKGSKSSSTVPFLATKSIANIFLKGLSNVELPIEVNF